MLIVPEKPLITVEGRGTLYANTKNYCMDNREPIKAIVQVKCRVKPYALIAHVRFE